MSKDITKKVFQGSIIYRMLGEDDKKYEEFVEEYKEHSGYRTLHISPQLRKMAEEYRRGVSMARLMREYGVANHGAFYRIVALTSKES